MLKKIIGYFRRKLAWELSLLLALVMLVIFTIGATFINYIVTDKFKQQLIARADLASHSIQFAAESSSTVGGIQRFVAAMGAEEEFDAITLLAGNPLSVLASTKLASTGHSVVSEFSGAELDLIQSVHQSKSTEHQFFLDGVNGGLHYVTPVNITGVLSNAKPIGNGVLYIRINTQHYSQDLAGFLWVLIAFLSAIGLIVFLSLVLLITLRINQPHLNILKVLNQRKLGNKVLCEVKGSNEIAILSETFNELFESIDEVEKLKSEFVSTVSHELRTPLTAIRGSLGVVMGAFPNQLPEQATDLIKMASRNCEQLNLLINDLLDLEKMESGKLEFEFVKVDLANELVQAKSVNDGYGDRHEVQIVINRTLSSALVMADVHRLQQVFANLISNAIKFSDRKSEV